MNQSSFSHLDSDGRAHMVDVSHKSSTVRSACAQARVQLGLAIARQLAETGGVAKGNVIETARLAGIMGAKRTSDLIPMCHPLALSAVTVDMALDETTLTITATVRCTGPTGVEMEAMTAASIAALTVYDMCKSAGKGIIIDQVRLVEKRGGKSGHWHADDITPTPKETPDGDA